MPQIGPIQGASMANAGKAAGEPGGMNNKATAQEKSGQVQRREDRPDRTSEYRERSGRVTAAGNQATGAQAAGTTTGALGVNRAAGNSGQIEPPPLAGQPQAGSNQANAAINQNVKGTNEGNQPQAPGNVLDMLA